MIAGILRKWKLVCALLLLGLGSALGVIWKIGGDLCAPRNCSIPTPLDLPVEAVVFPSSSGASLHGWLVRIARAKGVVILMHGAGGNRTAMLDRARFLTKADYSVLLFDFQAHGESQGAHITFGQLESRDAQAAVEFCRRQFPGERIGVIGGSLGGAAAMLATPPLAVDALVLEAVFPTIQQAVADRLRLKLGAGAVWLWPLLVWQIRPRLGFSSDELRPLEKVRGLKTPKLFIAGTNDRHTPLSESRQLFGAAAEPKELWEVPGAAHEDFHRFTQKEYEQRVLAFLGKTLAPHSSNSQ